MFYGMSLMFKLMMDIEVIRDPIQPYKDINGMDNLMNNIYEQRYHLLKLSWLPKYKSLKDYQEELDQLQGTVIEKLDHAAKLIMAGSKFFKNLKDTPMEQRCEFGLSNDDLTAMIRKSIEYSMIISKLKKKLQPKNEKGELI